MSRLSKNIIYNFLGQGLLLILGFIAVKYVFKFLGEDALGVIYFTAMMNALLCTVLEMGVCRTTVREVAANHQSNKKYVEDLIRTFSLFYWSIYILTSLSIFLAAPVLVQNWINLKSMEPSTATYILRILGITSLLALPKSFYVSLFRGLQRMEYNNVIDVVISALQQVLTIVILVLGGNLFHVVYCFASCYILSVISYLVCSGRFFSMKALLPGYSLAVVKSNFLYSSRMVTLSILLSIHKQADKIILSKVLPIGAFGYYTFAYSAISKGAMVPTSVSSAAFPSFSDLFFQQDKELLTSQYHKLHNLLCWGTVPLFGAVPFFSLPLFTYLFNGEVAYTLLLPVTILSLAFYMNATLRIPSTFSQAVGRPEIVVKFNFIALFITIPITVLLTYHLKLTGAAMSWVFYYFFAYIYAVPRIYAKCLDVSVRKWYWNVVRIYILVSGTYGLGWIVLRVVSVYSIFYLSLTYIIASMIFGIGAYYMAEVELRKAFLEYVQAYKNKIKIKTVYTFD